MDMISKYVHFFNIGQHHILYHALTTKVFFVNEVQANHLRNKDSISVTFLPEEINILKSKGLIINPDDGVEEVNITDIVKRNRQEKPDIFALYLILTEKCNMNCSYCSENAYRTRDKQGNMDAKTIITTLENFYNTKSTRQRSVTLYGGEPLMNKRGVICAVDYIRDVKKDFDTEIVMYTNATLLDETLMTYFSKNRVSVIVSIDGDKEKNDKYRLQGKQGTFDLVNNVMEKMCANNFRFSISATVTEHNVADMGRLVQYFIEKYDPVSVGLSILHTPPENKKYMAASAEETTEALLAAYQVARKAGLYIDQAMFRIRPFVSCTPRLKDCPSCGGVIRVLPNGHFGPCSHLMEESINIETDQSLFEESKIVQEWNHRLSCNLLNCEFCEALSLCGGGCPYNSLKNNGDLLHSAKDHRTCTQAKTILMWLLAELCNDFPENVFCEVTKAQKQKLLGNIDVNKDVPLDRYWKYEEFSLDSIYE